MKKLLLSCTALTLMCGVAAAQTVVSPTSIDLTPITTSLIQFAGAALTGISLWIGWYVKNLVASKVDLSNTQMDEMLQQQYNEAAMRAIAYAETVVGKVAPKSVDVNNVFVKTAADYVIKFWPDLVKKVNLTPEKVRETIVSRLPSASAEKADDLTLAKASASAAPVAPQ